MALKRYGVLKGRVVGLRLASGSNPHYQVHVVDDKAEHRIAINVRSQDGSDLQYVVEEAFRHHVVDELRELPPGFRALPSKPGGAALDYIRANLMDPRTFTTIPMNVPGPDNDLNEKLDHYVQRAMADESAMIHAFGQAWGPETIRDKIFGFTPGAGIHDIHMNQGNDPSHRGDDGVWQDGGLVFQFPGQDQWVAVFLRFQSQAWHTDDTTGHTIAGDGGGAPSDHVEPDPLGPTTLPTTDRPDGLVRIVGALVNDKQTPERETVTILNTSDRDITLDGWAIADKQKNKQRLDGTIAAGATKLIVVKVPVALSNKGGIISLLDDRGLRVDGVSYTRDQVRTPGWTIVF